jgi:oligosaccharide repeat unit polymerase
MDSGNFDAYQNFARVVHDNFISYGRQLIGTIFFFIPRSIWPNKPTGSGSTLADMNGQPFGNISMPYIAEGYINFGIFGVILFMFFLGYILNTFDTFFWNNKKNKTTLFNVYYTILIGLIFFIMRGDMLSSISYTIGLTICFLILTRFFKFII